MTTTDTPNTPHTTITPTSATHTTKPFASPVDTAVFGTYRAANPSPRRGIERPFYPFQGRIGAPGSSPFGAEPGRYHLYVSYGCPWAQITSIVRAAKGLADVVTTSYVDEERDGRGWAFRERFGADPVNGFLLLREAYEATEPGYDGHISVPALWDRSTSALVSNDFAVIPVDLATGFDRWANGTDLYPAALRPEVDAFGARIAAEARAGGLTDGANALAAHEARLGERPFVHGESLTLSDIRLWVTLIRFETTYRAAIDHDGRALPDWPNLWAYTRRLFARPEFASTTDLGVLREHRERVLADASPRVRDAAARREEAWARG
ncbi:glutathione S-transferase C-terminal domain-containing protein [Yinghuangia sp. ASG 101]|uniref:glutathione S-transferase C-terminal domain-containing protein n=1 Tax=Yinghuangia sp. ASG 101 TaxID=2896848 RepID=UPI001E3E9E6F|nr:glutathione S-transferase C-terminal domain-containing protein [Yinghuangia sp. ASG 101]UGQ12565.1 glutathione S-transferase C-terminal domain-containing protein [Yinghuangia sp. ASG 101]